MTDLANAFRYALMFPIIILGNYFHLDYDLVYYCWCVPSEDSV